MKQYFKNPNNIINTHGNKMFGSKVNIIKQ